MDFPKKHGTGDSMSVHESLSTALELGPTHSMPAYLHQQQAQAYCDFAIVSATDSLPLSDEEVQWCEKFLTTFEEKGFSYKGYVDVPSARHAKYIYEKLGPKGTMLVLGWEATEEEIQRYKRHRSVEDMRQWAYQPTIRKVSPALHPVAQLPQAISSLKSTISRQEAPLSRKDKRALKSRRRHPKRSGR